MGTDKLEQLTSLCIQFDKVDRTLSLVDCLYRSNVFKNGIFQIKANTIYIALLLHFVLLLSSAVDDLQVRFVDICQ